MSLLVLTLLACNSLNQSPKNSYDDGVQAIVAIDDLDGNGIEDIGNQSYAFGETDIGAAVGFLFSATLPVNAEEQDYSLFGSGNDTYVTADNGFETAFLPLPEMINGSDEVVGYGAQGIRDGNYTVNCGLDTAIPHTATGWCQPDQGLTADDDVDFLKTVTNGGPDCAGLPGYSSTGYITTYVYQFSVINGRLVKISGTIPIDPNCYAY